MSCFTERHETFLTLRHQIPHVFKKDIEERKNFVSNLQTVFAKKEIDSLVQPWLIYIIPSHRILDVTGWDPLDQDENTALYSRRGHSLHERDHAITVSAVQAVLFSSSQGHQEIFSSILYQQQWHQIWDR